MTAAQLAAFIERKGGVVTLSDGGTAKAIVSLPGEPNSLRFTGNQAVEDRTKADFYFPTSVEARLIDQSFITYRGETFQIGRINPIEDGGELLLLHVIADPDDKPEWPT